nr:hypothetical protein [Morchella crassipes]
MIKMTPPLPLFTPPPSLHVMRGVEGGRGSDHLIILMAASPPPPFLPPSLHVMRGVEGGRARKDSKTSLQFPQQPILSLHKSSSLMALGAKREEERRPSPPPTIQLFELDRWVWGGPGKGWLGKPLPPRKDEEGGWDGKWREVERGGCIPPSLTLPPPPNPFIFYRRSTGLGGEVKTLPLFTTWGSPPPEHKAKGGIPKFEKRGERERRGR